MQHQITFTYSKVPKKMVESKEPYRHLVVILIFLLAIFLLYKLLEPLLTIMLAAAFITYISYPLYRKLRKWIKSDFWSRVITLLVIIIVLVAPMAYLVVAIRAQTVDFYNTLSLNVQNNTITGVQCRNETSQTCMFITRAQEYSATKLSAINFNEYLGTLLERMLGLVTNYLFKIPQAIIGTTLILFIVYFLLKDGNAVFARIMNWLPLRPKTKKELVDKFEKITYSIVFAQIFVAAVQGAVGMLGFWIFGVPNPVFWGIVMAFVALIPVIGPAVIWAPAAVLLALGGYLAEDTSLIWKGVGLFVYGILIISTIDNILRIKILDKRVDIHPLIVILGVVGGVSLFGILGLFLGPIILVLLITFFDNFKERFA